MEGTVHRRRASGWSSLGQTHRGGQAGKEGSKSLGGVEGRGPKKARVPWLRQGGACTAHHSTHFRAVTAGLFSRRMCVCVCVRMRVCVWGGIFMCVRAYAHVHTHVYACMCVRACAGGKRACGRGPEPA